MRIVILFILLAVIVVSGCTQTGQSISRQDDFRSDFDSFQKDQEQPVSEQKESKKKSTSSSQHKIEDKENIEAESSNQIKPPIKNKTADSQEKKEEEPKDPCKDMICEESTTVCPDGERVSCTNSCSGGVCSSCEPDCSDHQKPPCKEQWSCTEWSLCEEKKQTRTCIDDNSCGTDDDKPDEEKTCIPLPKEDIEIIDIDAKNEIVTIQNTGTTNLNLLNWTLQDSTASARNTYTFPDFILKASFVVRIHKGSNTSLNNATDLFRGKNNNVWNNDHDSATLRDNNGEIRAEFSY